MTAPLFLLALSLQATPQPAAPSDTVEVRTESSVRAPEVVVYERARAGVVRVRAGLSHGTGFIIRREGLGELIVTNDHVIAGASSVSVILDSLTRVPAQVVVRGRDEDLALLRIHPGVCDGCAPLQMAALDRLDEQVRPGVRVVALGFPLTQHLTMTSGIVASVRDGAVISDVNINPGNSGGPLIAFSGEVVGVNTFLEEGRAGPGISGSIAITELEPLLEEAADTLASLPAVDSTLLPVMADESYPVARLRSMARSVSIERYNEQLEEMEAGDFRIRLATPVSHFVAVREYGQEVGAERRERERRAGVPEEELFSALEPYRSWVRYVGNRTQPAVTLEVRSETKEKLGSAFARAFAGGGQAKFKFKGDVGSVRLYRNGTLVEPLLGGPRVNPVFIDNPLMELKDVVGEGYYAYRPETFRPDSLGVPPSIVVAIEDLKEPEENLENRYELPPKAVARVWNDFEGYFQSVDPGGSFTPSNPDLFKSMCDERERWPDDWPPPGRDEDRPFCDDI